MFTDVSRFRWIGGMAAAILGGGLLLLGPRCAWSGATPGTDSQVAVRLRVENYADARWSLELRGPGGTVTEWIEPRARRELRVPPGAYRVTQTLLSVSPGTGGRVFETRFEAGSRYRWALLTAQADPSPP